jgi:hypothetical protein
MFLAACDGDVELVRYHLDGGVDPDHVHPEVQSTALVAAVLAGHEDVAHLLLDHGADPGLVSPLEGLTPLEAARQRSLPALERRLAEPTDLHGTFTGRAPDLAGGTPSVVGMTSARTQYRLALVVAAGTVLVLLYGIGALGIVGGGGPYDLLYVAAAVLGLVGALVARFRPRGMAVALTVAAVATVAAGLVAIAAGQHRVEGASVPEILGLSAMFAAGYAVAAWLFRRASEQATPAR